MTSRIGKMAGIVAAFLAVVFLLPDANAFDRKTSYSLSRCIMGGYYEQLGEIDKAVGEYKRALKVDRQNAFLHLNLASAYLKKNDVDLATRELTEASNCDSDAVEPHAVLALLLFSQNKPDEASREYEKALTKASLLEPKNTAIYKNLAALYMEQNNYAAAERTYKLVIELAPSDHEAYFFLANVYDEQGRKSEAVASLKKTIELKPDYHQALNYLGYVYADGNTNLDEAGRLINKALELEPGNGAYVDSRGWLLYRRGKYAEAVTDLEKAVSLVQDPVIYDHLGDTYTKLKEYSKAEMSWRKSLELDPKQESVRKKLEAVGKPAGQERGSHEGISRRENSGTGKKSE